MKKLLTFFTIIALIFVLTSCEKKDENPFIRSRKNSETIAYGSVVATMTFKMVVTVNNQNITTSNDYLFSYTDSQITVKEKGKPEETTDYMISGNSLILSFGGMGLTTFIKI